jgi:hypothetical protein
MSVFDQSGTCSWCGLGITRSGRTRAPWQAGKDACCRRRNDGKYYHEPLEPGETPRTVCMCDEDETELGYLDPTNCTIHTERWTP